VERMRGGDAAALARSLQKLLVLAEESTHSKDKRKWWQLGGDSGNTPASNDANAVNGVITGLVSRVSFLEGELADADGVLLQLKQAFDSSTEVLRETINSLEEKVTSLEKQHLNEMSSQGETSVLLAQAQERSTKLEMALNKMREVSSRLEMALLEAKEDALHARNEAQSAKEEKEQLLARLKGE